MPICLLCPSGLEALDDIPDDCDEELQVSDRRDDYSTEEGDGVGVGTFLDFCEEIVRKRCHLPDFRYSDWDSIDQDVMDEIPDPYTRALLIKFANEHYESYRDDDICLPSYDDIRSDSREYCDECDAGWTEIHGEYDGDLAEDVEDDEDEDENGITAEERAARHKRNEGREEERERRQSAQEEAEGEVVDREFTCDDDCDAFRDHVDERFRNNIDPNHKALEDRWNDFLEEAGESVMPELLPEPRSR